MAPRTLVLPENTKGRDFVVGDIHGAFELLEQALLAVKFDPEKDRLIAVGDLVDRGPSSSDCLYYLSQPWFYSIRGNHEEMFMRLYKDGRLDVVGVIKNLVNGMGWMLKETSETLEDIRAAFEKLPVAIEIQTKDGPVGFVHADVPAGMDWHTFKQKLEETDPVTLETAIWSRKRLKSQNEEGVGGVVRVFCGHTPVEGGPKALGNCFFVDTGAVFKLMNPNNTQDLFMALIDIRASTEDIIRPETTKDALVRTSTVRDKKSAPPPQLKTRKPPSP